MDPKDAIVKILREVEGALHAEIMDECITKTIRDEEESVRSMTGADVINKAYHHASACEVRICIFCDRSITTHEDSSMTLEDLEGNVLGMILKGDDIDKYKDRSDVLWVSDDFIMFPNIEPKGGERFILQPIPFPTLTEEDGCKDVVLSSPAPSSDLLLKKYFGRDVQEKTATLVLGYNII